MKKMMMILATATMVLPAAPALADPPRYDRNGRYVTPQRVGANDRVWQGEDGRYYCRRSNGTTGLIIGAAGGALAGRAIDTRGERATGTILGAAAGAILGREIQRNRGRCR